eukprot:UC4_evm1s222
MRRLQDVMRQQQSIQQKYVELTKQNAELWRVSQDQRERQNQQEQQIRRIMEFVSRIMAGFGSKNSESPAMLPVPKDHLYLEPGPSATRIEEISEDDHNGRSLPSLDNKESTGMSLSEINDLAASYQTKAGTTRKANSNGDEPKRKRSRNNIALTSPVP